MCPLISVITITYNAEETVGATMRSLREQDYRGFEHIVIDGASKDRTLEIVRGEGGPEVRILSEPDSGLYDAMNKGLRLARGKYVLFLNAGDTFSSAAELGCYARGAETDPDIIYADTRITDASGNIIGPRHLSVPETLTHDSFLNGMLVCHQAFMARRSLVPEYDLAYRYSADYDWCIRILEKARPEKNVNLHRVAINYLSDGLTDRNKIPSLRERFSIMRRHYGTGRAVMSHLSFIPRAIRRHIPHENN